MKKNLLKKTTLAIAAICFATNIASAQVPVPDVLHYLFNGTGTSVTNYASSPPAGTATGTIVGAQTQTGTIGCMNALVGTGTTVDYVNTGWVTNLSGSWSISFWVSAINQPTTTLQYIFGDNTAGSFRCFTNGIAGAGNWILRGTGITDTYVNAAATSTPNMVTFVYDNVALTLTGYKNAVVSQTTAQTAFTVSSVTGPFKVGQYGTANGLGSLGLMGDFRIYSSALTPAQVLNLYNSSVTPSLSVSGSNSVCLGNTATLTASGASTFTWSTGSNSTSIVVTPTANTTYTLSGSTGTCSAPPAMFTVSVSVCTSLSENAISASDMSVSPNPTSGEVTINVNTNGFKNIQIMDVAGRVVYEAETYENSFKTDLSNYAPGIYIGVIKTGNSIGRVKIIKE